MGCHGGLKLLPTWSPSLGQPLKSLEGVVNKDPVLVALIIGVVVDIVLVLV